MIRLLVLSTEKAVGNDLDPEACHYYPTFNQVYGLGQIAESEKVRTKTSEQRSVLALGRTIIPKGSISGFGTRSSTEVLVFPHKVHMVSYGAILLISRTRSVSLAQPPSQWAGCVEVL